METPSFLYTSPEHFVGSEMLFQRPPYTLDRRRRKTTFPVNSHVNLYSCRFALLPTCSTTVNICILELRATLRTFSYTHAVMHMQSTVEPHRRTRRSTCSSCHGLKMDHRNKLWETNRDRSIISVSSTGQAEQGQPSPGPRFFASPAPAHQRLPNRAVAQ